jgi:hypothetical protein
MNQENTKQPENHNTIEELTLNETTASQIKGGPSASDYLLEIDGVKGESSGPRPRR